MIIIIFNSPFFKKTGIGGKKEKTLNIKVLDLRKAMLKKTAKKKPKESKLGEVS